MKVSLVQTKTEKNKDDNIKKILYFIKKAALKKSDFVLLPEMWNCPYDGKFFKDYAEERGGPTWKAMADAAKENGIYLIAGSIPEKDGDKIYNTCFVFDRKGNEIDFHRKVHLYDVCLNGKLSFSEGKFLEAGKKVSLFQTEFGLMSTMICFDIRFPEMARKAALEGAKAIFVPASFNTVSGPKWWNLMFQSRAVDNQLFMFASSTALDRKASYKAWGHSLAVNPDGSIIKEMNIKEGMICVDINLNDEEVFRNDFPLLKARKSEVYDL